MTARVTTLKGPDAGLYYVEALPSYYLDADEPAGYWLGDGARALGLEGAVDDEAFLALMAGLDPATGEPLGRRYGEGSVRGFDVTASAPKSVSVLFALGDVQTRQAVLDAHDAAVASMVSWIEDHAHTRRRVDGQVVTVDAEGIAAACFRQHTSRALDPQLHTHVVIANRVASDDGRWLALDARTIKVDQRTLSAIYHAGLRAELSASLGVAWKEPVRAIAELADVPEAVRQEFSSRTRDVDARVEEKLDRFAEQFERDPTPRERWRLEREAVTDSRPSKSHCEDAATLHREWSHRAVAIGHAPELIVAEALARRAPGRALDDAMREQLVEVALEALAESQSTWRPAELVRELAAAVPPDAAVRATELAPWLDRVAEEVVAERLVDLSRPAPAGVALRRDGRPTTEAVVDRVLTTPEILAQEERLIAWAERRLAGGGGDVALEPTDGLDRLSGPQREAASALAGTRDLVLVVGPAGAGKTAAVAPAIEQLRADGRAVFGVAPSAAAAEVLSVDAGVTADTLDKLLVEHRLDRPPDHRYDLPSGATVVVDEAAMVPTPKLAELAELADDRGWRLALVGDPLQFSAVGRSGMFGHLVDCYGAIELDRVHRFANEWERDASLRLRRGDPDVLDLYDRHGRLHGGTRGQMERAVVDAWWETRAHGASVAMMAPTNDTVADLNRRAQERRIAHGEIDPAGPSVRIGDHRLYVGDEIATRHNDRQLRTDRGLAVKNRDRWEVGAVLASGAIEVSGRSGTVLLPPAYLAEHVELAYAQTSHAAQGRTVDRSFLLLDGTADTRGVYVPMTRGRHANEAFVVIEGEQTAPDVLGQALARDWIDQPAVALRAELRRRAAHGDGRERIKGPLEPSRLRELLERHADITQALSDAEFRVKMFGKQIDKATERHAELTERLAAEKIRRDEARRVIDDYDHPLQRRFHRTELDHARVCLRTTEGAFKRHTKELAEINAELPGLRSSLQREEKTLADRPALDRERRQIDRELGRDLAARRDAISADPPARFKDWLGPRPERGSAARWDEAAARIDQHRCAFNMADGRPPIGSLLEPWEKSAFAISQRAASLAMDRLDRSIGRAMVLERPGPGMAIGR